MVTSAERIATRLRDEARADGERARARADGLRAKLPAAAALLRQAGAQQVWLLGSLASGTPHVESEVDLAVEALPSALYFDVLADLMELFGTRVDLVALETAPESLRERVFATGLET